MRRRHQVDGRDGGQEGDELSDARVERAAEQRCGPQEADRDPAESRRAAGRSAGEFADGSAREDVGAAAVDLEGALGRHQGGAAQVGQILFSDRVGQLQCLTTYPTAQQENQ